MADNVLTIPLEQDFRKTILKDFEKYIPVLADNIRIIGNLLTKEQRDRVRSYQYAEEDSEDQKEVLKLLKEIDSPAKKIKQTDSYWKQYKKIVGRDFEKYLPLISDNIKLTNQYLSDDQKKKVKEFETVEKTLEQQSRMRKLLEEANQMKFDLGIKKQLQTGKTFENREEGIIGQRFDAKNFNKYIPVFSKNMGVVADLLTEDQKQKIKFYQQQTENAENLKKIAKILKEANKSKYQRIKDKITEKYNQFLLKNRWFEKSMDSFKNMGRTAGHWIWEIMKAFLVLSLFDPNSLLFKMFMRMVEDVTKKFIDLLFNFLPKFAKMLASVLAEELQKVLPTGLQKFFNIDKETIKKREEEEKRRINRPEYKEAKKLLSESDKTTDYIKNIDFKNKKQLDIKIESFAKSLEELYSFEKKRKEKELGWIDKMSSVAVKGGLKKDFGLSDKKIDELINKNVYNKADQEEATYRGMKRAMSEQSKDNLNIKVENTPNKEITASPTKTKDLSGNK
jgi:hypothetical protein